MADRALLQSSAGRRWLAPAPFCPPAPSGRSTAGRSRRGSGSGGGGGGRRPLTVVAAKKGGKGGGKKGPGSLMDVPKPSQQAKQGAAGSKKDPWTDTSVIMHNLLLIESHYRKVGRPILEGEVEISQAAKALWDAPFAVLAHDRGEPEPRFVYGNAAALALFECTWDELIGTPSAKSAEPDEEIQGDRSRALAAADERGCIEDYEGWRVSFKGTRFKIKGATVFNVEAPSGDIKGQAAVIRRWEYEDGTVGGEGAEEGTGAAAGAPPTAEELQAAEAGVTEQAAAVRALKEEKGLTNADEEVKAAVAELLARKAALEQLQQRAAAAAAAEAGGAEAGAAADGAA